MKTLLLVLLVMFLFYRGVRLWHSRRIGLGARDGLALPWDVFHATRLSRPIEERVRSVGFEGLSEAEATIAAPTTVSALVGNGGFACWFGFYGRAATLIASEAFERLELLKHGAVVRAALDAFPGPIPDDLEERRKALSANAPPRVADESLMYREPNPLFEHVLAYARAHRAELVAAVPAIQEGFELLDATDRNATECIPQMAAFAGATLDRITLAAEIRAHSYTDAIRRLVAAGPASGEAETFWNLIEGASSALGLAYFRDFASWHLKAIRTGYIVARVTASMPIPQATWTVPNRRADRA